MILLVLVVLLWVAVLAPSAWRRFGERQGVGSIDHFHHQLQLLEHAGPKTVAPAYRLHTAFPGGRSDEASRSRRRLVPTQAGAAAADGRRGRGRRRRWRRQPLRAGRRARSARAGLPAAGRARNCPVPPRQARRRCTTLLRCLGGVAISTALIGVFPGMHLAWVFTGLTGLAALGLVGLMAYAKELEAEQARRRSRREAVDGGAPSRYPAGRLPRRLGRGRDSRCPGPRPAEAARSLRPRPDGPSGSVRSPTILGVPGV